MPTLYIIRHKASGKFLTPAGDWASLSRARIFNKIKSARGFIYTWERGTARAILSPGNGSPYARGLGIAFTPVPNRTRSQLEIVPCTLTLGVPFDV